MKILFVLLIISLALSASILLAADFWEKKKFTAWSVGENIKMLEDSPWALKTYIKFGAGGGMGPGGSGGMDGPAGMGGMTRGGRGGMGAPGAMGGMGTAQPVQVILRWHSALPIKQALASLRYKDDVETSEEASKVLSREEPLYVVGVIGMPGPAAFYNLNNLKAGSQLRIQDLPPIQAVQILTDQQATTTNLYIVFPKLQEGAHIISVADKDVEVFIKTANIEIKRKFKLKNMVYDGKLEL